MLTDRPISPFEVAEEVLALTVLELSKSRFYFRVGEKPAGGDISVINSDLKRGRRSSAKAQAVQVNTAARTLAVGIALKNFGSGTPLTRWLQRWGSLRIA